MTRREKNSGIVMATPAYIATLIVQTAAIMTPEQKQRLTATIEHDLGPKCPPILVLDGTPPKRKKSRNAVKS